MTDQLNIILNQMLEIALNLLKQDFKDFKSQHSGLDKKMKTRLNV